MTADAADPVPSSNPLTGDQEAIETGRKLYGTWCSQCHGAKADGVSRFGKYAGDLRKFNQRFTEFARVVVEGRTERRMPPWDGVLDGEQVSQIGAYLETLEGLPVMKPIKASWLLAWPLAMTITVAASAADGPPYLLHEGTWVCESPAAYDQAVAEPTLTATRT